MLILVLPGLGLAGRKDSCLFCHPVHYDRIARCSGCHRGNPRSQRKNIAHAGVIPGKYAHFTIAGHPTLKKGQKLVESFGCRRCHIIDGTGNSLASNLDQTLRTVPAEAIARAIKAPALFMPHFNCDDTQVAALVNAIESGGRRSAGGETVQVIHFSKGERDRENVFIRHCGSCHKVLSVQLGGLGRGEIGPNLSGLFSRFYPGTTAKGQRWTRQELIKWLENPRQVKAATTMTPVLLTLPEMEQLLNILDTPAAER